MNIVSSLKRDVDKDLELISNLKVLTKEFFEENDFQCNDIFEFIDNNKSSDEGSFGAVYFIKGNRYVLKEIPSQPLLTDFIDTFDQFTTRLNNNDIAEITFEITNNFYSIILPQETKIKILKDFIMNNLDRLQELLVDEDNYILDLGIFNYIIMLILAKKYRQGECINFLDVYGFKKCFYDIVLDTEDCQVIYLFKDYLLFEKADGNLFDYLNEIQEKIHKKFLKNKKMKNEKIQNKIDLEFQKIIPKYKNIIIQIIFSIIFYQKKLKMTHRDLTLLNVLYSKVRKNTKYNNKKLLNCDYYYYIIDDKKYCFEKTDIIIKISDFDTIIFENNDENIYTSLFHNFKIDILEERYTFNDNIVDFMFFIYLFIEKLDRQYLTYKENNNEFNRLEDFKHPFNILIYKSLERERQDDKIDKYTELFKKFNQKMSNLTMIDILNILYNNFDYRYQPSKDEK